MHVLKHVGVFCKIQESYFYYSFCIQFYIKDLARLLPQACLPNIQCTAAPFVLQLIPCKTELEFGLVHFSSVLTVFVIVSSGGIRMGGQEHFYMETQSMLVVPVGEEMEFNVYVSTQWPTSTQVLRNFDQSHYVGLANFLSVNL